MMDIFQTVSLGIVGAVLALTLKNWRPELAAAISIAVGVLLLTSFLGELSRVFSEFGDLMERGGVDLRYFRILVKVIGIAYLSQFGSELCRDCGQSAIALKVELAGKIAVFSLTVPILVAFLELITEALSMV